MAEYKQMYYKLFNVMTDVINTLMQAQQQTESMFIESGETPIHLVEQKDEE